MNIDELEDLLCKSYSLGFEDGVSSGDYYKLDEKWKLAKSCLEEDLEVSLSSKTNKQKSIRIQDPPRIDKWIWR